MNAKQRAFAEYYAQCGNATKAAELAGYSPKTAYSIGNRLLKNVEVSELIKQLQAEADAARIATIDEVKEFWTGVMRNKEERQDARLRASELLAKAGGAFITQVQASVDAEVNGVENDVIIYLPSVEGDVAISGDETVFCIPDNNRPIIEDDE